MAQTVEGTIEVPGGNVWFKRVGGGRGFPLLTVHGGPGLPHNYLRSLEQLADEREVIFWDQLGCGNSERPVDPALWTVQRSVAEVNAVVDALGLDVFHLFGNSWGGMLAQQYVLDGLAVRAAPTRIASLTVSNGPASISTYSADLARLKSRLGAEIQSTIDHHEAAGTTDSVEYQQAITVWCQTHICRAQPWPDELLEALANQGAQIYQTMIGQSDFHITGNLHSWDVLDRLAEIQVPTLLMAGKFDGCTPEHMWDMHQRIEHSQFVLFESSAHVPFIEEPERFHQVMRDFLRRNDAA